MSLMKNGSLCAVYGSLRYGLGNHRVISGAPRQDDGIISGKFRMVSLNSFPGLIKTDKPTDIVVEVYEVNNEAQAQGLDWLEGYPSFYDRELVTLVDGRECWVYFLDDSFSTNEPVDSGNWKLFKTGEA